MFSLVISVFMIFQFQQLVSTDEVLEFTPTRHGYQIKYPWLKTDQLEKTISWETKSPRGYVYKVVCKTYTETNPKVDIFTNQGVLLDSLFLENIGSTSCDEANLKNYIFLKDPENGKIKVIYLWADGTCVERKYEVEIWEFMAAVKRSDYPKIACPEGVKEFLSEFATTDDNNANKPKPGGIVTLLLVGEGHLMDYISQYKEAGETKTLYFPEKDIEGKRFKLVCREDMTTTSIKVRTGSIIFEDGRGEDIVLERFKMKSCSTTHINVNRQIHYIKNDFKVVFKMEKGECYERKYTKMNVNLLDYYDETTLDRMKPVKVTCPNSFVGDINMNAYQPFYSYAYLSFSR